LIADDGPAAVVEMWNHLKSNDASVIFDKPRIPWLWPFSFKIPPPGALVTSRLL
jgi:hypothetical protein